jgi:hypothetical protein
LSRKRKSAQPDPAGPGHRQTIASYNGDLPEIQGVVLHRYLTRQVNLQQGIGLRILLGPAGRGHHKTLHHDDVPKQTNS